MEKRDIQAIVNEAFGVFPQVATLRRTLHRYPELSFGERRTSAVIADALGREGIAFRHIADTGILARIEGLGRGDGNVAVVLRADMDALPITEVSGVSFASANKGVMHACGHDMHSSMLFGALKVLARHCDCFSGTVFGLFQPGEESNPGGAVKVLAEEPFAGYDVQAFIGQHVEPSMRTGTFGFRAGKYMASSDELRFHVRGVGGHAALRERIKDPVGAAADLVRELYRIPAAATDDTGPTIVSIGKVVADGATNVVPDEVYMEGTMRTFDETWRARVKEMVRQAAAGVDAVHGVSTAVEISDGYPCVSNDRALTERIAAETARFFGADAVAELGLRPTADDFGFYTLHYPSLYYRIGVGGDGEFFDKRMAGAIHTPTFCPDEKALGYGVVQFLNIVFTLLGNHDIQG